MRAPLLSATSSLDRICTIGSTIYSRIISELFLDNFHQSPALQFAQWTRLHNTHCVAGFRLVLFVMRVNLFLLVDDFPELRMRHTCDCPHYNRLIHATRNHFTGARFARTPGNGRGQRRRFGRQMLILLNHKFTFCQSVFSRCESTVSIRATSRRNKRNRLGCSSWPLCCCKRRCRLSWRKSRLFVSNSSMLISTISLSSLVLYAEATWCRVRN